MQVIGHSKAWNYENDICASSSKRFELPYLAKAENITEKRFRKMAGKARRCSESSFQRRLSQTENHKERGMLREFERQWKN